MMANNMDNNDGGYGYDNDIHFGIMIMMMIVEIVDDVDDHQQNSI